MVETISPVVHGGRDRNYPASLGAHILGATASASLFGVALGGLGALLGAPWGDAGMVAVAGIAAIYAARELLRAPVPLPDLDKQVPDWWRTYYSRPVAGFLYGAGLGIGFLTFLTFGTYVAVAAAALASGSPGLGALYCGTFGLARTVATFGARAGSSADEAVERLSTLGATRGPRLVNGAALVALAAAALLI